MSGRRRDELTADEERWLIIGEMVQARRDAAQIIQELLEEGDVAPRSVAPKPRRRGRAKLALVGARGPSGTP
jgi:hypothetical protein